MASKGKRKAEVPKEKDLHKKKHKRDEDEEEENDGSDDSSEGIDEDELAFLQQDAVELDAPRRTRGIRIDYTKVAPIEGDDEDDEDEEEKPVVKSKSADKGNAPAKPISKGSTSVQPKKQTVGDEDEGVDDEDEEDDDDQDVSEEE